MTEEVIYPTAPPGPPLDLCHLTNKLQVTCLWRIIHAQTQTDSTHIDGPLDWLIAVITFTFDYQRIDLASKCRFCGKSLYLTFKAKINV